MKSYLKQNNVPIKPHTTLILLELDLNVKFPLLRLFQFLSIIFRPSSFYTTETWSVHATIYFMYLIKNNLGKSMQIYIVLIDSLWIEQKGMTFGYDSGYSFPVSLPA